MLLCQCEIRGVFCCVPGEYCHGDISGESSAQHGVGRSRRDWLTKGGAYVQTICPAVWSVAVASRQFVVGLITHTETPKLKVFSSIFTSFRAAVCR